MAFVPLFCRSHHSPLGVSSPTDLVRRARLLGYGTLGLCDEATIAGLLEFDHACRTQGIRPVFGCRLFVQGLILSDQVFPLDFLIETEQGYRNLVRLLTYYHRPGAPNRRPLRRDDLRDRAHGLIPIVPPDGELPVLIWQREREKAEQFLKQAVDCYGPLLAFGASLATPESAEVAGLINKLASFTNLHALAAPVIYFPEPGDAAATVYLENSKQAPGRVYAPPEEVKTLPALWPEAEMLSRWAGELEEVAHESGNAARRCTWRPARIRRAYPSMDLERGYDPNSYLFDQVIRGATQRYGEITEAIKQRINREFEDIKARNLAPYLLLNHQIAEALDDRGISRGVGRGRLVTSVLAYCLGITRIDPLRYNLMAKSLIGEDETFPPIHVEIPGSGIDSLLVWLRETYGEEHLAEIGRVQMWRRDQMISELARWAGMTDEERRLTLREKSRLRSAGAVQRLDEMAESSRSRRWRDPSFLGDVAARLAPRPRYWTSTGDCFVLSGDPLEYILPRVNSQQGRTVTGIEEDVIDTLGLARLVFVPHQLLDILDQAMRAARAENPGLDFRHIELDDRATFEMLSRGDTIGIPPFENVTLRCLLRKNAPANLLQLLRIKTEAAQLDAEGRPRELADELPDVILSYQCAYLKANYPLAFYSAAIGAVIEQHGNPSALVRAARREGYDVHAPDINLSDWGPTISAGSIRLGLAAVRGFGRKAWENVNLVRSGGNFTSLENFCERVDTRIVTPRLLRALINAGAMDSFEQNRASMDATISTLQRRMRERIDAARSEGTVREGSQATLFELEEWSEVEEPAPLERPNIDEWNTWEKLQRESDALGFYLSIDPVNRFKIALEHLRPLPVDRLSHKYLDHAIRVVGIVGSTEISSPLIESEGDLLVDLEGLPVVLPAHLADISAYCLDPGTEVFLTGRLIRHDGYVLMQADGIWRLADLEDQATKVAALSLQLEGENRQTLKLLLDLVHQFPGNTQIRLTGYAGRKGFTYRRLARRGVFFCSPLYQGLCKILPTESIGLYGQSGEPLLVKSPRKPAEGEDEEPESASPE